VASHLLLLGDRCSWTIILSFHEGAENPDRMIAEFRIDRVAEDLLQYQASAAKRIAEQLVQAIMGRVCMLLLITTVYCEIIRYDSLFCGRYKMRSGTIKAIAFTLLKGHNPS
jgi:hypothetical protein